MALNPILIVEDDRKIARIVKAYLEGAGYRAVHAETGKEAIALVHAETPMLVILDLMLPDMSGEEVCEEIKENADIPVIMLTARSSEEERIAGFSLGADDYVVKPFSPRELVYRVRAVLKRHGQRDVTDAAVSYNGGDLVIDGEKHEVKRAGHSVRLTPTEFRVLHVLASSPNRVFPRDELVEKALGYQFEGYERSIDAHIKNVRHKIGDDPKNPSFILTIYGVGYRFNGRRDSQH